MTQRPTAAVILAAGLGKRMKSEMPKVLHEVCGEPMIEHVLREVMRAGVEKVCVVTGHKGNHVREAVGDRAICVEQAEQLGTGHAVRMAEPVLGGFEGNVLVCYGDMPLVRAETYRRLIEHQAASKGAGVMLSAMLEDPFGYGRIVRAADGSFRRIVEQRDASEEERRIREVNTGLYCFDGRLLFKALAEVRSDNAQGEFYLTDVPAILLTEDHRIDILVAEDAIETLGVNSREQLAEVSAHLRRRILSEWMAAGVTVIDPATTIIERRVTVGRDTVLEPFTVLRGATQVGERCVIGPQSELIAARVGDGARVRQSVVKGTTVPPGATVGPFAHVKG